MAIDFFWTLPAHGDGKRGDHADYAVQVARAAELAGFRGLTIPYDPAGEDAWITGAALARETKHLTIVPEFRPGFASAVYTAKLSFTFQRFFNDRLGWKLDLERPRSEAPGERLTRAEELLSVAEGVWGETPFDFAGRFFSVEGGALFALHRGQQVRVSARRFPIVYASGEDPDVLAFSAAHADVHLFDTIESGALRVLIERHRALAEAAGRSVRYGLRLAIGAAEYESEAWTRLRRLWADVRPGDDGSFESRRIDQTAWHGFAQIGHVFDAGLVGTYRDVAERLAAYVDLGITAFVLEAVPHVEEAYRLGEQLLPHFTERVLAKAG
jgi:alkanesulfonate monooxygenase